MLWIKHDVGRHRYDGGRVSCHQRSDDLTARMMTWLLLTASFALAEVADRWPLLTIQLVRLRDRGNQPDAYGNNGQT